MREVQRKSDCSNPTEETVFSVAQTSNHSKEVISRSNHYFGTNPAFLLGVCPESQSTCLMCCAYEAFLKDFPLLHLHQPTQRIKQEHLSTVSGPFDGQDMSVTCAFWVDDTQQKVY
ncbi:unnamed protein product [Caenorhabditis brenneri]